MGAVRRFLQSEDGPTAVEYAVMMALLLMTCIVTIKSVGDATSGIWANNNTKLSEAGF
ncbi:Flp family type IVb pilin [Planctomicrobium piriforme]|uniref:Pilus assembly protein Flp/PilA n=1 Tax=Planctomicrobium piriforme TaxID=1576369 RepID=A0A1I3DN02_9PLAN|nr:Flp family type IVb pilin [Planctomicrobium piriforme]SFH88107.1 pilus assembly protein Flp/PilA [Planctomicrobium piriforme]